MAIGITSEILAQDQLHAFNLGPVKTFCAELIWELVLRNVWGAPAGVTQEELVIFSCNHFRHELFAWYKKARRLNPQERLSELQDFVPRMIGTRNDRSVRSKAAETKGVLLFLVHAARTYVDKLNRGDIWLGAATSLERMFTIFHEAPVNMTHAQIQDDAREHSILCVGFVVFLRACVQADTALLFLARLRSEWLG